MGDTKIKICGITTPDDARQCQALGADLLGLIFAKSPRKITLEQAKAIREAVPEALMAGVFVDAEMEFVIKAVEAAKLDMIQLHGHEPPAYCEKLMDKAGKPVVRAFKYSEAMRPHILTAFKAMPVFLFDLDKGETDVEGASRGLWELAAWAGDQGFRILLAGGLDTSNVQAAVAATVPYGVDVCRGVEVTPGVKDMVKVKRFIEEVKQCP